MPTELDQLTPNYLTVNPDGTIGADFSGTINAQGILFPAAVGGTNAPNQIRWIRSSNSALLAYMTGIDLGASGGSRVQIRSEDGDQISRPVAHLELDGGQADGSNMILAEILRSGGPNYIARVIDDSGRSSFLQLLSAQQLQLALGTGTFVFTAGTVSAAVAIAHGLGRIPAAVVASCESVGFTASVARGNPNNTFTGFTAAATTANVTFDWIAIG